MAAFRRCILALAVLAAFASLASAQSPSSMTCSLSSLNTAARAEGHTELVSDLLISCTGGSVLTNYANAAPTVNFTLSLPANVTSRTASGTGAITGASEALLLIDDPGVNGGPVGGFGTNANATLCTTPSTGCTVYPNTLGGYAIMSNAASSTTTTGANVYQGIVSNNTVSFFGVPVVPPGTNSTRTYRITNVRIDANAGSTGAVIGSLQVQGGNGAGGSGAALISLNQTQATLATVQSGLTSKWNTNLFTTLTNCAAFNYSYSGYVSFSEGFASAFKTRQQPTATLNSAQSNTLHQTTPGSYFSESGFELALNEPGLTTAGLADYGTRLKAVFKNIPSGATVYVSFANVTPPAGANPLAISSGYGVIEGSNVTTSLAELINGSGTEDASDGAGTSFLATPTTLTSTAFTGVPSTTFPLVKLTPDSSGNATAVWEVLNDNPAAIENFNFAVFVSQTAAGATGTATVNASFAPTITTTSIPKFADTSTQANSFTIGQCTTTILFPYVTSNGGFDTGIAVSNTTTDTLATKAQAGACNLYLYGINGTTGAAAPAGPFSPNDATGKTLTSVPSGQTGTWLLSGIAPGITGYAIAVCNFQYAHGFAFVADWTSTIQSSAMGYLGLIVNTTGGLRNGAPESLGE